MENTQNNGLVKTAMIYGVILGLSITIYSFILFITNVMPVGVILPIILFIVLIGVYFTCIYFFTKKIRNNQLNGYLTFGEGFLIGFIISLTAAIITSVYTFIQNQYLDPTYMTRVIEAQKSWMTGFMSGKVPDETIEETLAKVDQTLKDYNPVKSLVQGIIGSTLMGSVIALISSAILKKKRNPFETQGTELIDNNI